MKKEILVVCFIFLAALALRLIAVSHMEPVLTGDASTYNQLALSIKERAEFSTIPGRPTSWRPPCYPFFLALIYMAFGYNHVWVGVVQALMGTFTCILIYLITCAIFNRVTGILAGILSAFYLYFIVSVKFLMSEGLFIFLFLISLYCLILGLRNRSYLRMFSCGLFLGLTTLTKPITLFFPVFLIILLISQPSEKLKITRLLLIMTMAFLIPVSAWTARNYAVHGEFVPVSTNGGVNFFTGNVPGEDGRIRVRGPVIKDDERAGIIIGWQGQPENEISRLYFKSAIKYIAKHPLAVARVMVAKSLFLLSPFDWYFLDPKSGGYNYSYGFVLPFGLYGIFLLLKRWKEYSPLYLSLFYLTFMTLVFSVEPRYRIYIDPLLIIFSSYTIYYLFKKNSAKWKPVAIVSMAAFLNIMAFAYSSRFKDGIVFILEKAHLW